MAFLDNHRELIAGMAFFTVPTVTFGVLYCFFVIAHDRRRILHINVTRHPTSGWVVRSCVRHFPMIPPTGISSSTAMRSSART
jgi:putative transposase